MLITEGTLAKLAKLILKNWQHFQEFAKFCNFLAGSVSSVSKPNFARKYAFGSICQALQDLHTFAQELLKKRVNK